VSENDLNPYAINFLQRAYVLGHHRLRWHPFDDDTPGHDDQCPGEIRLPINIPAVTAVTRLMSDLPRARSIRLRSNLLSWIIQLVTTRDLQLRLSASHLALTRPRNRCPSTRPAGRRSTTRLTGCCQRTLDAVQRTYYRRCQRGDPGSRDRAEFHRQPGGYRQLPDRARGYALINFPSGFASASNLVKLVGYTHLSGSAITMSDTTNYMTVGAAWYAARSTSRHFHGFHTSVHVFQLKRVIWTWNDIHDPKSTDHDQ